MERPSSTGTVTRRGFLVTGVAGVASLAGCIVHGEDDGVRGTVSMDGSNTVLPHGAAVAEEFLWRNNRVTIPVVGSGTGAGFQNFCEGATDIQNASRPILEDEQQLCADNSVEYIELEALRDGIAIFAHPDNHWCDSLTVEQLRDIWGPGTDVETWADIDPDWPDEEFALYGRDPGSGTFDSFTERLLGEIGAIRGDYSASADTNVIVRGVSGDRHGLGWGGAGYYYENEDDLKLIGIPNPDSDSDEPIFPTRETVETGEYAPLSRSMFVYINTNELHREVMRAFTEFYFEEIDEQTHQEAVDAGFAEADERLVWTQWAARKVGFYAASDDVVEASHDALRQAIEEHR